MTELDQVLDLADAGQFDSVEDQWLAHMSSQPDDMDFFVVVAKHLADEGEEERARFLLDLLEESLTDRGRWVLLIELIRRTGVKFRNPTQLHTKALETVRKQFAGSDNLEALIEKVGLTKAIENVRKSWQKIDRLQGLMQFDKGAVILMHGKGVGRVTEVNLELESFKLDLEHHPGLRVGFAAATKLLKPLPEGHFLRRRVEEPEELRQLAQSDPGQLLLALLQSSDEPISVGDIKQHLGGLVPDGKWTSWWAGARKHPQLISSGSGARQTYSWASTTDGAHDVVRQGFDAADIDKQLTIYKKEASRSPDLSDYMARHLGSRANDAVHDNVGLALTIWNALDRNSATDYIEWSPRDLLETADDLAGTITAVPDRSLREKLYAFSVENRSDWSVELAKAIRSEVDPKLLSSIAQRVRAAEPGRLESALEEISSQPKKFAAGFVWIVENAQNQDLIGKRNSLRLLQQIFDAFHQQEFTQYRNRLLKTLDGLSAAALLRGLTEDQAERAQKAIDRSPVDEHIRDTLIQALKLQFPSLDKDKDTPLYATKESIEKRRKEMKNLLEVEIPANRKAIEEARELGDLKENFEYKSARQRHEYLNARVEGLQRDLSQVRPFDPNRSGTDEVRIGSQLVLDASDGKKQSLKIMGPWESDPDQGIISYASELGEGLLGKKVGDTVDVDGKTFRVVSLDLSD